MDNGKKSRNPSMDIIRCFALFCVIGVHFFLYSGFYDISVNSLSMFLLTLIRNFFMICVPLFIVLSGYLLRNKLPSIGYYLRIVRILSIYVLASFCCAIYRYNFTFTEFSMIGAIIDTILGIFSYSTAPYGWYIEMYLGLFLLIPYLNILFKQLPSKKHKNYLLAFLVFLTAGSSLNYIKLFPTYWASMYPITYYLIGSYLAEYPLKIRKSSNLLLIGLLLIISGSVSFYHSNGSTFMWSHWSGHASLVTTLQTILVFTFLAQRNYTRLSSKSGNFLSHISNCCLGAYLVSWIFDDIFYRILNSYQSTLLSKSGFFIPITIAVYVCSLLLSAALNFIYNLTIKKMITHLWPRKPAAIS